MSHLIKLRLQIKDLGLFAQAAQAQGHRVEHDVSVKLFSATRTGLAVHLPDWQYPVVVDKKGDLYYDNYRGRWGDVAHLNELVLEYAVAVVERQALQSGQYITSREQREDGTLVLCVGGGW